MAIKIPENIEEKIKRDVKDKWATAIEFMGINNGYLVLVENRDKLYAFFRYTLEGNFNGARVLEQEIQNKIREQIIIKVEPIYSDDKKYRRK